jgi:uncharacterized integral membrane protein (TIGR00698 family)
MSEAAGPANASVRDHIPGLAVTVLATLAAAYVSDHYGAPLTLMCLLFGLAMSFLAEDPRLEAGLAFASRTLLRLGIVLAATRVTLGEIAALGPVTLAAVAGVLFLTLGVGVLAARALKLGGAFGALCGGAVAICGASAAMAFASLLGEKRISQAQLALVLVGVSAMSALAMALYPVLAETLGFNDRQAGFLMGAAIHDVAQALGAGYSVSDPAGETATIVKLARVALLAPALLAVALFIPRDPGARLASFVLPWFVLGFFALSAVNSAGWIPKVAADASTQASTALLACAVTATGVRSNLQSLTKSGVKPLAPIAIATVVALVLAASAAWLLLG